MKPVKKLFKSLTQEERLAAFTAALAANDYETVELIEQSCPAEEVYIANPKYVMMKLALCQIASYSKIIALGYLLSASHLLGLLYMGEMTYKKDKKLHPIIRDQYLAFKAAIKDFDDLCRHLRIDPETARLSTDTYWRSHELMVIDRIERYLGDKVRSRKKLHQPFCKEWWKALIEDKPWGPPAESKNSLVEELRLLSNS